MEPCGQVSIGRPSSQAGLAYEYLRKAGDPDDLAMTDRMLKEVRATVQMPTLGILPANE